jgi:hypothetical protein
MAAESVYNPPLDTLEDDRNLSGRQKELGE